MSVRTTVKSIQDIMRKDVGVDGDAQRISQLCWMFFLKIIDDQDEELRLLDSDYVSPIPKALRWTEWAADPEGITGDELLIFVNEELFPALKELSAPGAQADRARVVREVFEDAYNYMKSGQLVRQVINKINSVDFNDLSERQHFGDVYEQVLNDLQSAGNAGEYYTPRAVTAFMAERIDPRPGELLLDPACGTGGFLTSAIRHMRDRYVKKVEDEERMQSALRAVEKKQLPHMLCVTNMLLHGIEDPSFVRHDNTLAKPYVSYINADRVDVVLTNPPFGGKEEDGIESNFPSQFQTRETADLFLALIIRLLKPGGRAAVVLPDGSLFGEGVKTRLKETLLQECNLHTIVRLPNSVFRPYASIGTNLLFFEKGRPTEEIWFYEHRVPDEQKWYSMTRPIRIEHLRRCIEWWGGLERKGRVQTDVAWRVSAEDVRARGYNLDIKNPHITAKEHGEPQDLLADLNATEADVERLRNRTKELLRGASVKRALIFEEFDRLSGLPDVSLKLRRFVLDLAVRGRLSEPEAPDERLLTRSDVPAPWTVPDRWGVVQLTSLAGEDGVFTDGDWVESKDQDPDGDVRLTQLADVGVGVFRDRSARFMRSEVASRLNCTYLEPRDILIARMPDPIGRACLYPGGEMPAVTVVDVAILRPRAPGIHPEYVVHALNSPSFASLVAAHIAGTTRQRISRGNLSRLAFPVPPLMEQRRIVAKVNGLMAACDELASSLALSEAKGTRLLEAVLAQALGDDDKP